MRIEILQVSRTIYERGEMPGKMQTHKEIIVCFDWFICIRMRDTRFPLNFSHDFLRKKKGLLRTSITYKLPYPESCPHRMFSHNLYCQISTMGKGYSCLIVQLL